MVAQIFGTRGTGSGFPSGALTTKTGGDVQGFAGLSEIHLVEIIVPHAFEVALGGEEESFSDGVLTLAKGLLALSGIPPFFLLSCGVGGGELGRTLRGVSLEASAPIERGGPAFDGAKRDAELANDGEVAPLGAKFKVPAEGRERGSGLAGDGRERGRGVG